MPGDLIVGTAAVEAFQRRRAASPVPVRLRARETSYAERAAAALLGEPPGSSAGGEFAKFTTILVEARDGALHVIVKFSPADNSAAAVRWRDLLIAEHHAPAALSGLGVPAAASDLVLAGGRVFLEVPRFDRVGEHGRHAALTLGAIEPALLGLGDVRWDAAAAALHRQGWLPGEDAERITRLSLFGDFIGNSDMHGGTVGLLQRSRKAARPRGRVRHAADAVRAGTDREIVPRRLAARPTVPGVEAPWREALVTALGFWSHLAVYERVSDCFRQVCAASRRQLQEASGSLRVNRLLEPLQEPRARSLRNAAGNLDLDPVDG